MCPGRCQGQVRAKVRLRTRGRGPGQGERAGEREGGSAKGCADLGDAGGHVAQPSSEEGGGVDGDEAPAEATRDGLDHRRPGWGWDVGDGTMWWVDLSRRWEVGVWVRGRAEGRDEGGRWGLEVQWGDGVGGEGGRIYLAVPGGPKRMPE